ncbi:hypothetical protein J14TS2_01900 [Bacillus sp. J14TS2]|nr:hypothetical protein J14TS2_01900 [Bacillus sp. J14TS2]
MTKMRGMLKKRKGGGLGRDENKGGAKKRNGASLRRARKSKKSAKG